MRKLAPFLVGFLVLAAIVGFLVTSVGGGLRGSSVGGPSSAGSSTRAPSVLTAQSAEG